MTMIKKRMTGLVLCLFFALATPAGAQVQVTQQRVQFDERVVEITEPVMRGFMNGLDVELRLLVEYAKHLATHKTPEVYRRCSSQVGSSPEFQKIQMQVLNWPENATPEQAQRLSDKMAADMAALLKNRCGGDIENDWPVHKRREKIEEIQKKAAAAAGPVNTPTSPPSRPGGPAAIDDAQDADLVQGQGPSTDPDVIRQVNKYERAFRYCKAMQEALAAVREAVSGLTKPDQALQLPGEGKDVYWMYTKEETKAIGPKCAKLRPEILVIEALEAKIADCPGGTECVTIKVGEAVEVGRLSLDFDLSGITIKPR